MGVKRAAYEAYLSSDDWQVKREACLKRDRYHCRGCGTDQDLHVHHLTYERFTQELPGDLITVCQGCHSRIHAAHSGQQSRLLADVTGEVLTKVRGGRRRRVIRKAKEKAKTEARPPTHRNQDRGWVRDVDPTWGLRISEGNRHGSSEAAKRRVNGLA